MPALLLALLLAGLCQARHLHEHDDAAKHAGADHCTFCLQVERLASAPSEIPAAAAWAAPDESPERAIAPAPRYLLAFSYDARGPPAA